jgi:hypothetical protein
MGSVVIFKTRKPALQYVASCLIGGDRCNVCVLLRLPLLVQMFKSLCPPSDQIQMFVSSFFSLFWLT